MGKRVTGTQNECRQRNEGQDHDPAYAGIGPALVDCIHGLNSAYVLMIECSALLARSRSDARRSFDLVCLQGVRRGRTQRPCGSINIERVRRSVGARHDRLTVIVIDAVMAMSMHGPGEVFFQSMRMTVLSNHFCVLLKDADD
jgi:hypothetical protein